MIKSALSDVHILVVDDEQFARTFVKKILDAIGITVVSEAENGLLAIEALKTAESPVDLVICDVEMPELGGYEFVRRLRFGAADGYREVPVLMLTGKDAERNQQKARINKINGFITKPPSKDVLKQYIELALEG